MFIRKRKASRSAGSNQVIQTYRERGKVRQRVIYNLGRHSTIEAALDEERQRLAACTHPYPKQCIMERMARLEAAARSVNHRDVTNFDTTAQAVVSDSVTTEIDTTGDGDRR